jgi:S-adenosylmethionine decarboxylase
MGETFGLHLMVDGYGCDPSILKDEDFILRFLSEFPEDIGMTKLMSPYVVGYEGSEVGVSGLSGFVLIAESHVSVHTFPSDGYVSIDVFSCKPFDTRAAETEIVRRFGITRIERNVLDRGIEYPSNPSIALDMVEAEREQCRTRRAIGARS